MIKATKDRVLLQMINEKKEEENKVGSLFIPETAKPSGNNEAIVISVGSEVKSLNVNDKVLCLNFS